MQTRQQTNWPCRSVDAGRLETLRAIDELVVVCCPTHKGSGERRRRDNEPSLPHIMVLGSAVNLLTLY